MRREWEPEDLVACWTLVEHDERELVAYKRGATRLGFALMLKFFEIDARFPRHVSHLATGIELALGLIDDEADVALPIWAGVIPLELTRGDPVADEKRAGLCRRL